MFCEKIKEVSVTAMQDAIAKAISELTGQSFTCIIESVDISNMYGAKLKLSLSEESIFGMEKADIEKAEASS